MFGFLKKLSAESLFKNTAFLFGNLVLTAGCGLGALTLLTRLYSVQAVGLSATAISACALVINITQFGVTFSLPRFLPAAKDRSALINTALTTVLFSTVLVAVIFLALPYAKTFFALGGWIFAPLFVLAASILAVELVLATVLIADRAADKAAAANVVPNLLGLAAPVGLVFLGGIGSFIARVVSDIVACLFYSTIIVKRGHRFRLQLNFTGMREIIHFSIGMQVANFIGGIPVLLLPLIVLSRVGAKEAAYWGIAMSVATFLFQLPSLTMRSLLPEASHRPTERRQLFRRSVLMVSAIVIPALAFAYLLSPIGLGIFGRSYATGALGPLHWLIISALLSLPVDVTGAILVLAKKSLMTTIANAVDAIVILVLVEMWAKNVTQIAVAWAIGEVGNIVLFGLAAFLALREVDWRWEDLGDTQADSSIAPVPRSLSATGQLRALNTLMIIAEQQRAGQTDDLWLRRQHLLTDTRSLFAVAALRDAELRREQTTGRSRSVRGGVSPTPVASPRRLASDASSQQAFDVLFDIAERQRSTRFVGPDYRQAGGQDHSDDKQGQSYDRQAHPYDKQGRHPGARD